MSKIIYVCFKDPLQCNSDIVKKLETIVRRITPDNITPRPPKIVKEGNIIYGITNPASTIEQIGTSVLLGVAYGIEGKWWEPGAQIADGSFSLFRSDSQNTEVITDAAASRTVWYYHDDAIFIASSSQRAIVTLLGDFQFNNDVIPWMLSSGSLGPSLSWDKRIQTLAPDSCLKLEHKTWTLTVKRKFIRFDPQDLPDDRHQEELMSALKDTFRSIKLNFSNWILPLSGGYDSRGILSLLRHFNPAPTSIRAVTWGLKSALGQLGNDAYIAKKLADFHRIQHKYYFTDVSQEPIERVFTRFLVCGEGRIDHISGYMDGFKIWETLFNDQIEGVIRGDEGFGWESVNSYTDVKFKVGLPLCSDISHLKDFKESFGANQALPTDLQRQSSESLESWRDRLYHQFRMPVVLAALSDLKLPFVEVINPLLSRQILYKIRGIPSHLRTDKVLFKRIVNTISPKIGYATSGANADAGFVLQSKEAVELFKSEFSSESCRSIISEDFAGYLIHNLAVRNTEVDRKQLLKSLLKRYLPTWLRKRARRIANPGIININVLAFRMFIISRMNRLLQEDASVSKPGLL